MTVGTTRLLGLAIMTMLSGVAHAEPIDPSAANLAHALDRLATTGRVLYVAAHPDDENTRLLAYLANVRHVEVAYLSMTRGGGGQNLIGGEQGVLLDVIRTEELLAARRIDSARQYFTRMRDFGYSKRADETLAVWNREEALADVVRVVRTFQPDVIVTRFSETPPNHGHHTASAMLAREAFAAAADPKRFPEQLAQGLAIWQARRLVHNVPSWSGAPPPPATALKVELGAYDARRGLEIGELAARSRSQHKSQGFGVAEQRGPLAEYFVHVAGTPAKADLLDGIDVAWTRLGGATYAAAIADAKKLLDRDAPARALPALVRAHRELGTLADQPRVRDARAQLAEVIVGAAGVFIRANASRPVAAPSTTLDVALEIVTRGTAATVRRADVAGVAAMGSATFAATEKKLVTVAVPIGPRAPSIPYWLARPPQRGHYVVDDAGSVGAPLAPPALTATIELAIGGYALRIQRPVIHAWTDRVHGEQERPFTIVPPATITPLRDAVLAPGKPGALDVRVRAGRDGVTGRVELALPAGWTATPNHHALSLAKLGDEVTLRFVVRANARAAAGDATPIVKVGDVAWSLREDAIEYPHIPRQLVLRPATVRVVPLDLRLPAGRVGYVQGSGDTIAADLAHVGMTVDVLDDETLRAGDLARYSAIVVGVRAYNTRAAVRSAHARLVGYVARGGTLVVQYHTSDYKGPLGPYPFELSRDRITDETAAPTFVDPKHALLARPNRITARDFDGWVQERGIYFGAKWDAKYRPLLRFADPQEAPLDGALLVAPHGRGRYIYTGLALFRQLPAGVPGAYRLLANLIGGGK